MSLIHSMRIGVVTAAVLVACGACSTTVGVALQVGRDLLLGVAGHNYSDEYQAKLDSLLESISNAAPRLQAAATTGARAAGAAVEGVEGAVAEGEAALARANAALASTVAPLAIDVAVLRETQVGGRWTAQAIADGEVVHDGVRRSDPGDNLKLRISLPEPAYVYAVWIDATAWAVPVFPRGPGYVRENPLAGGVAAELPGGSDWFYLDDRRGVETLYVLVSRTPRPDLQAQLDALSVEQRPELPTASGATETVSEPHAITRGLAGKRPGRAEPVQTSDGTSQLAAGQSFFGQAGDEELVITRWFRHE